MDNLIIVRGAGDIATGTIYRLFKSKYPVLALEVEKPSAIRRTVSFCEAVYEEQVEIEGVICKRIYSLKDWEKVWREGKIPLLVDAKGESIKQLSPAVVIDAILAKKNLGTNLSMAPVTIGYGPGFSAKKDVNYVIETMRGHDLGKIITEGLAMADTGIPGIICGYGKERVVHSPASGQIKNIKQIGDIVKKGEDIAYIGSVPVKATLDGILRGIIRDDFEVKKGLKIADIDPRITEKENCYKISDKARCISGSVLEIILSKGIINYHG